MMKRCLAFLLALSLVAGLIGALAEDAQIGYINADTKVYMDASEKAIVDGSVTLGAQVRIEEEKLAEDIGWYRVTFLKDNKEGWVKADDVDLVIAKKAIAAQEKSSDKKGAGPEQVKRESDFPVLTASGQVDPDTLPGAPKEADYKAIAVGDSGKAVDNVVSRLFELGYVNAASAKKFAKTHESAIKQFQKANGLTQDGVCSPALQAKLFSLNALNKKGKKLEAADALTLSKGQVKNNGDILFTVKNNTGSTIDAFDISMRLYNTYGERFLIKSIKSDATLNDELTAFNSTLERNKLKKNGTAQYGFSMSDVFYFAGVMITVTAYHVEGGDTVRIPEDQQHWFGFGKGAPQDYQPLLVTPLTGLEKKRAENYQRGIDGVYVDAEIAKDYGVREGYLLQKMEPGCMFDYAGLKAGDVLLAIGDTRIFSTTSIDRALSRLNAGESTTVLFFRNGAVYQTQLVTPGGETAA